MPGLSRWVLERVLAHDYVDDIIGDLEERYAARARRDGDRRARWWYAREAVLLCLRPGLLRLPRATGARGPLHGMSEDVRFAFRLLHREPLTSALIVLTLAIGIGATTMVFSATDRFLVRLPDGIEAPDRLVEVYRESQVDRPSAPGYAGFHVISLPAFRTLQEATTLEASSLLSPGWMLSAALDGGAPERLDASFVSANWFELLGARLVRGRGFEPVAEEAGASPVVVLSHAYWQRRFGGDPDVLGRTLHVEGRDLTVVGVTERDFVGTSVSRAPDVWIPLSMIGVIPLWGARAQSTGMYIGVARVRDGLGLAAVETELAVLGSEFYDGLSTFRIAPLREVTVDPNRRAGFVGMGAILLGSVATLLLIGCLNVANILLARSIRRQRELAVRVALGAGRTRLFRQLFTETALLYVIGGIGGIGLLLAARPWIGSIRPPGRFFFANPALDLPIDLRVLAFTLLATALCAMIFGMLPAWRAVRRDPRLHLHPYGGSAAAPGRIRSRDALVVLQIAFCLVALAGAGVFLRGLQAARAIDPGFDPRNAGMVSVNLHYVAFDRDRQHAYYRQAIDAALSVPGVSAAGISWLRPLEFGPTYGMRAIPDAPPEQRFTVRATAITPGYLEAAGVPLLAGRDFRASDRRASNTRPADARYAVILNERAAELAWPGEPPVNAIGRTIYGGFVLSGSAEVIGIVPTGRQVSIGEEPAPAVFTSLEQMSSVPTGTLFFRTHGPPEPLLHEVAARVRAIDPAVPVHDVEITSALIDRALWGARASAALLAGVAALGLLLAALGIYGVVSSVVGEQRREMGIRLALGAGRRRVYHLLLGRVFTVVAAGIVIGFVAVAAVGGVAAGLLYGVPPTDPVTLAAVATGLLLVALLAAFLPARQATRVDPLEVLRAD